MSIKRSLSIVACFTFALVGVQYAWAQQVQPVSIVDQNGPVKVKVKNKVAVQMEPIQPVQWTSGQGGMNQFASFPVPDGKRLVIESFWFEAVTNTDPLDSVVGFNVSTTVDGTTVEHRFGPGMPLGPAGGFGQSYRVDKSLRLYADPNTVVGFIGQNSSFVGSFSSGWSGYFVDAP